MLTRGSTLTWATALLSGSTTAHMIMQSPVPFSVDKLDNGPLQLGDFPCKQKLGFTVSTMNEIPAGQNQSLTFKGSAVHGGGSCQVSISLDKEPTANSKFKVIRSFEGGCPGVDGGPFTDYKFMIPTDVPTGQVTLAWTWFSKLAGQNEMYMNCAPVKVTGGAASASSPGFDALPDMFVANIPESSCKTQLGHATKFPNPGTLDTPSPPKAPEGDNLAPTGSCGTSSGGGAGGSSSSAAAPSASSSPLPSASSSSAGGVFAPGASSAAGGASSAIASTSTLTTLLTVTASQTPAASSPVPVASSPSPAAPTGTGSTSNGTACSPDGAVVCNGSTKFGLCNHGQVVWQDVAAGTTCANGVISRRMPAKQMIKHKRNPHIHSF